MDHLLNVITAFSLLLIGLVLASVRRAHIRVEYSVSWLLAALVLLVLSRWRGLEQWLGAMLGINDGPLALLILAGAAHIPTTKQASSRSVRPTIGSLALQSAETSLSMSFTVMTCTAT